MWQKYRHSTHWLPGLTCLVLDLLVWRMWSMLSPSAVKRKIRTQCCHWQGQNDGVTTHVCHMHGTRWGTVYVLLHVMFVMLFIDVWDVPTRLLWNSLNIPRWQYHKCCVPFFESIWCLYWLKYTNPRLHLFSTMTIIFQMPFASLIETSLQFWPTYLVTLETLKSGNGKCYI